MKPACLPLLLLLCAAAASAAVGDWTPPDFCGGRDCPRFVVVSGAGGRQGVQGCCQAAPWRRSPFRHAPAHSGPAALLTPSDSQVDDADSYQARSGRRGQLRASRRRTHQSPLADRRAARCIFCRLSPPSCFALLADAPLRRGMVGARLLQGRGGRSGGGHAGAASEGGARPEPSKPTLKPPPRARPPPLPCCLTQDRLPLASPNPLSLSPFCRAPASCWRTYWGPTQRGERGGSACCFRSCPPLLADVPAHERLPPLTATAPPAARLSVSAASRCSPALR